MARALGWGTIHRLWQMLLKGLQDVEIAPDPREAAEMALLRLIHAADMPDPAALIARLTGEGAAAAPGGGARGQAVGASRRAFPPILPSLVKAAREERQASARAVQLHDQVGLVRYAPPELVLKPMRPLGGDWPRELAARAESS